MHPPNGIQQLLLALENLTLCCSPLNKYLFLREMQYRNGLKKKKGESF